MKTYINKMTTSELEELVDNNEKIKNFLENEAFENSQFWIKEYLTNAKNCSYCFGDRGEHFYFYDDTDKIPEIIEYCEHLNKTYDFFYNFQKYNKFIDIAKKCYEKYYYIDYGNSEKLYNRYTELLTEINEFIFDTLNREYWYYLECSSLDLIEFIENYSHFDDGFIIDGDYSTIYTHNKAFYSPAADVVVA